MKSIIKIFLFCVIFSAVCLSGEEKLSRLVPLNTSITVREESRFMDPTIQDQAAMILPELKKSSAKAVRVSYEVLTTGETVHVGWYTDGCIITVLDGYDAGRQEIIYEGYVLDISYSWIQHSKYFEHYYPWGKVKSYSKKQEIKAY